MYEFNVGDKVTLKPREPGWDDIRPFYTDDMEEEFELGQVFTVTGVTRHYIDIGSWVVRPEWIEHAQVSLDNI